MHRISTISKCEIYQEAMQPSSLALGSLSPPAGGFSGEFRRKTGPIGLGRRASDAVVSASKRDYDGRLVDEDMIVLRKRIHEMKMVERNYEPPAEWMAWEKRYYTSYDSDICEAMGLLQSVLMETRPSVALGVLALLTLSLPTSAAVVLFHLMDVLKGILAGIRLA